MTGATSRHRAWRKATSTAPHCSYVGARGIMQLMPSTFAEVQSRQREFESIDNVEWNIAAGIYYDRYLWRRWKELGIDEERRRFMFGSYNAGQGTISRARRVARGTPARRTRVGQHRAGRARGAALAPPRDARLRAQDPAQLCAARRSGEGAPRRTGPSLTTNEPATAPLRTSCPARPARSPSRLESDPVGLGNPGFARTVPVNRHPPSRSSDEG